MLFFASRPEALRCRTSGWKLGKRCWTSTGFFFSHCETCRVKYKFIKTTFIKKNFSSKSTFIKNHFHQKPLSSKTTFIKKQFHQKPISSKTIFIRNHFHQKPFSPEKRKRKGGTVNIVRVCVKASPAEGRRRLHTNTAYARLSGFNKPSCGASPAEGRRCST